MDNELAELREWLLAAALRETTPSFAGLTNVAIGFDRPNLPHYDRD